jgi:hypothetical protein
MLESVDAEREANIPRAVFRTAVEQTRAEMEELAKKRCSQPCPNFHTGKGPHSQPGRYPFMETGEFVDGLRVVYSEATSEFHLYSKTHDRHGVFLQNGLRDGTTRPYGTLIQNERDWSARVNAVARKMNRNAAGR